MALNLRGREEGARPELDSLASLRAAEGGSSRSYVLVPSSPASADSTTDSRGLGFDTSSSVRAILGAARCSPSIGPESPSTPTYKTLLGTVTHALTNEGHDASEDGTGRGTPLIFSAAASPAKTSASPDNAADSQANDPGCSTSSPGSSTLFDPDGYSLRTYPDSSPRTAVGTSESCLERWPTSGTAWHGGFSTAVSSECRSDDAGCSSSEPSLSEILEPPQSVPERYSLSARAATGILRRAEQRGRMLPSHLRTALETVRDQVETGRTRL